MYAAFCEGSERGSVLNVHDYANDEQGTADAEWQSKKKQKKEEQMIHGLSKFA